MDITEDLTLRRNRALSVTDPAFPLRNQTTFIQFLAAGGRVSDIERYLRRVESFLAPKAGTQMETAAKLRDFATVLRIEIADAGLQILQRRIRQAELEWRRAEAKFRSIDASFQQDISKAFHAINDAAGLLHESEPPFLLKRLAGRRGLRRMLLNEREKLVLKTTGLVAALEAVEALPDLSERHVAFLQLHVTQSNHVLQCLEALELCRWRLPSPYQRTDLPGKYGVVKYGHFTDFDGLLRMAQTAWLRTDPTKVQKALKMASEAYEVAYRRSQDIAGMPESLMNWLAGNFEVHLDPLRTKAGERRAAESICGARPN